MANPRRRQWSITTDTGICYEHKLLINGELVSGEGEKQPVIIRQRGTFYWKLPRHPQSRSCCCARGRCSICRMGANHAEMRAECLLKLADVIEENGQVFPNWSPVIVANRCIVRSMMKSGDCRCFSLFRGCGALSEWSAAGEYLEGHTSMIRRDPLGVWLLSHRGIIR